MLASKPGFNHRLSRYARLFVITTLAEPMAGYEQIGAATSTVGPTGKSPLLDESFDGECQAKSR
jgi:hypothetical protein